MRRTSSLAFHVDPPDIPDYATANAKTLRRFQSRFLTRWRVRVMTLRTLADVRRLVEDRLPAAYREKPSWRHVTKELEKAARSGNAIEVLAVLSMVLAMEGVECRPRCAATIDQHQRS